MTICANCDRLVSHVIMLAGRAICDACDDHTRWCSCGLMLAGSARQIIAMAEVHWRTCGTWQLLTRDPRKEATAA